MAWVPTPLLYLIKHNEENVRYMTAIVNKGGKIKEEKREKKN